MSNPIKLVFYISDLLKDSFCYSTLAKVISFPLEKLGIAFAISSTNKIRAVVNPDFVGGNYN